MTRHDTLGVARAIAVVVCQIDPAADPDMVEKEARVGFNFVRYLTQWRSIEPRQGKTTRLTWMPLKKGSTGTMNTTFT